MAKKTPKRCGIYKIVCLVSGKEYYGSTIDWRTRKYNHLRNLRRGTHINPHLQNSFTKHGEAAFRFMFIKSIKVEQLLDAEQECFDSLECAFNVSRNATSPRLGMTNSAEMRRKSSASLTGHVVTAETRQKLREANIGKSPSAETRRKLGKARIGYRLSDDAKRRIGVASTGRNIGEKSGVSKLSDTQRTEICCLMASGVSKHELAARFRVDESTIRHTVKMRHRKELESPHGF